MNERSRFTITVRNIMYLHLSAAKRTEPSPIRAEFTSIHALNPQSSVNIPDAFNERSRGRLFVLSSPRPARPPLHDAPPDIQQLSRTRRTERVWKPFRFRTTCLLVSLLPSGRSFIVWLPLSWETPRPAAVIVTVRAHGSTVRMRVLQSYGPHD